MEITREMNRADFPVAQLGIASLKTKATFQGESHRSDTAESPTQ